jgi:glycine betaine/proline transport system substrate-binding protein
VTGRIRNERAWRAATRVRASVAIAAIAAATWACGPVSPARSDVPTAPPSVAIPASPVAAGDTQCGTVTLALNPWVGSEANVAVVGYLLEHELGCTVVKRQLDDETSWQFLASRGVDAILENWDHDDLAATYVAERKVALDAGPSGNQGIIGWFVPKFFVDAHPDILTAKTNPSILNTYADQFRTPESGQKGQVLDGDPGFVTEDRAMIKGFGLDYEVVYSGSEEASNAALAAAVERHTPIIAYFVTPNWFSTKVDLVHIELPAFTPGCNKDPSQVACDYPAYHLNKVVSSKFAASGSPAFDLIKRFSWTNDDQDRVAASIADRHLSDDEAARAWLDANPAKWRAWLP